jgi:hypothetical protein
MSQQTISKQIEEMHQQVRDFIKKQYPEYWVFRIDAQSETHYAETFARTVPEFRVYGVNETNTKELYCNVMVNSDDEMCIMSVTQSGRALSVM